VRLKNVPQNFAEECFFHKTFQSKPTPRLTNSYIHSTIINPFPGPPWPVALAVGDPFLALLNWCLCLVSKLQKPKPRTWLTSFDIR